MTTRETSFRENDHPGNDFPGNVFPGKKTIRESNHPGNDCKPDHGLPAASIDYIMLTLVLHSHKLQGGNTVTTKTIDRFVLKV